MQQQHTRNTEELEKLCRRVPFSYAASGGDSGFTFGINTSLTLISNITIPSNVGSARLSFYSRYFNDLDDTGNTEISTNGGSTWTSLRILTDAALAPPADTRMQSQEIDLTATELGLITMLSFYCLQCSKNRLALLPPDAAGELAVHGFANFAGGPLR